MDEEQLPPALESKSGVTQPKQPSEDTSMAAGEGRSSKQSEEGKGTMSTEGGALNIDGKIVKKVQVDTSNMPENQPVKYGLMGSESIPVDKQADNLYFTSLRIGEMAGLEGCSNCTVLNLRNNLILKIECLQDMKQLEELDLYDNRIRVVENLDHLVELK